MWSCQKDFDPQTILRVTLSEVICFWCLFRKVLFGKKDRIRRKRSRHPVVGILNNFGITNCLPTDSKKEGKKKKNSGVSRYPKEIIRRSSGKFKSECKRISREVEVG